MVLIARIAYIQRVKFGFINADGGILVAPFELGVDERKALRIVNNKVADCLRKIDKPDFVFDKLAVLAPYAEYVVFEIEFMLARLVVVAPSYFVEVDFRLCDFPVERFGEVYFVEVGGRTQSKPAPYTCFRSRRYSGCRR